MANINTLQDTFDTTTLNTAKWDNFGTAQITEGGGTLNIVTLTSPGYYTCYSVNAYDMTGSQVFVEVVDAGNQSLTTRQTILLAEVDADNKVFIQITNNNIEAAYAIAGVFTFPASTAYTNAAMRWIRLRESGGTTYWEYAANPYSSWSTLYSMANPITVTSVHTAPQAGNYGAEGSESTSKFDNFNVASNNLRSMMGIGT